jgi:hypothetical protein
MYWEKTVEYKFLWQGICANAIDLASPLSGKQERGAGDLILGFGRHLVLIEFKIDAGSLDTEEAKFTDYEAAKKLLQGYDRHHYLVYGVPDPDRLRLEATTYFSRRSARDQFFWKKNGAEREAFDRYLVQLLAFRKRDGRSKGTIEISDFANVMALRADGTIVDCCSLGAYVAETFPSLAGDVELQDDEPTYTPGSPNARR